MNSFTGNPNSYTGKALTALSLIPAISAARPVERTQTNLLIVSKPWGHSNVVEVSQVIVNLDVVKHAAQASQCHAKSVRAAKTAKLAPTFDMRLHVHEYAGNAASS